MTELQVKLSPYLPFCDSVCSGIQHWVANVCVKIWAGYHDNKCRPLVCYRMLCSSSTTEGYNVLSHFWSNLQNTLPVIIQLGVVIMMMMGMVMMGMMTMIRGRRGRSRSTMLNNADITLMSKLQNSNQTDTISDSLSLFLESKLSLIFKTLIPPRQRSEPCLRFVKLMFVKFLISAANWTRILRDLTHHLEWSMRCELTGQEWWL